MVNDPVPRLVRELVTGRIAPKGLVDPGRAPQQHMILSVEAQVLSLIQSPGTKLGVGIDPGHVRLMPFIEDSFI
jgi:hypothetical protein